MITVKVKNVLWNRRQAYAFPMQEFNYYTGEVVPNPRWVNDDHFCLATGDPQFPFRVIEKDRVVGAGRKKPVESKVKVVNVAGSKPGQNYLVTLNSGNSSCTCVGFGYRGDCKHIRIARAA
jgi:hypothetical protein